MRVQPEWRWEGGGEEVGKFVETDVKELVREAKEFDLIFCN